MGKKFALNILYTIGIMLCLVTVYWAFNHDQYASMLAAMFLCGLFIILKIKILKEVKNYQNKP